MIRYELPDNWIEYDIAKIAETLIAAKVSVLSLRGIPYQRAWVEPLQRLELKREVAGTSRIEGAEFTEYELDVAMRESPAQLFTRSQRQAHAAVLTYRWITTVPDDRPIDLELIREIHRRMVSGADDDHCPPGRTREEGQNVNFGYPRHRGAEGGKECELALSEFVTAVQNRYREHDVLVQALAVHYHLAAMHPFLDGNGRTARALEALMLQRAGLRDTCFIAMSNYYYDEKTGYLTTLSEVRAKNHDLTSFLIFGLRGIELQSNRLLLTIRRHVSKELFRNLMNDLFNRLRTPRKRVIAERQVKILNLLLEADRMDLEEIIRRTEYIYQSLKNPLQALIRDLRGLIQLRAIHAEKLPTGGYRLGVRLEWPTEITETEFFSRLKSLPKVKTASFLQ